MSRKAIYKLSLRDFLFCFVTILHFKQQQHTHVHRKAVSPSGLCEHESDRKESKDPRANGEVTAAAQEGKPHAHQRKEQKQSAADQQLGSVPSQWPAHAKQAVAALAVTGQNVRDHGTGVARHEIEGREAEMIPSMETPKLV